MSRHVSQTVVIAATLAAEAVKARHIAWDTPIKHILGPRFKLHDEFRTNQTTLRDLLSHRLGLPDYKGAYFANSSLGHNEYVILIHRNNVCISLTLASVRYVPIFQYRATLTTTWNNRSRLDPFETTASTLTDVPRSYY